MSKVAPTWYAHHECVAEGLLEVVLSLFDKFCKLDLVELHLPEDFKEFNQDVSLG